MDKILGNLPTCMTIADNIRSHTFKMSLRLGYNAGDTHLEKGRGGGTESLKKFPLPWLRDKESFEIYKL